MLEPFENQYGYFEEQLEIPQVAHSSSFTFLAEGGVASVVASMCMDEQVP